MPIKSRKFKKHQDFLTQWLKNLQIRKPLTVAERVKKTAEWLERH